MRILNATSHSNAKEWLVSALDDALREEKDDHIIENMVGDVPWSMKSFIQSSSRFSGNGFVTFAIDDGKLLGITGCEKNGMVFPESVQFGMRLWVRPSERHLRLPSKMIEPQLSWAQRQGCKAWTSHPEDRWAMIRMIQQRSKDKDPRIAEMWSGFQTLPDQVLLNNVMQKITYKDFSSSKLSERRSFLQAEPS